MYFQKNNKITQERELWPPQIDRLNSQVLTDFQSYSQPKHNKILYWLVGQIINTLNLQLIHSSKAGVWIKIRWRISTIAQSQRSKKDKEIPKNLFRSSWGWAPQIKNSKFWTYQASTWRTKKYLRNWVEFSWRSIVISKLIKR